MIDFPESTRFGKAIPFAELRRQDVPTRFASLIKKIVWAHKLAPLTIRLSATDAVKEIEVLDVTLKAEGESLRKRSAVLEMLDQKIPNPIIFRVFDEEGGELETAVYPKSKAGVLYGESPVYRYCRSNKFIDFPQGLTILESVLMALAAELGGMKVRAGESLKDFDARHYALESLRADLNDLEKRIKKESQLDRKYELAKERQSLERRIADVQS